MQSGDEEWSSGSEIDSDNDSNFQVLNPPYDYRYGSEVFELYNYSFNFSGNWTELQRTPIEKFTEGEILENDQQIDDSIIIKEEESADEGEIVVDKYITFADLEEEDDGDEEEEEESDEPNLKKFKTSHCDLFYSPFRSHWVPFILSFGPNSISQKSTEQIASVKASLNKKEILSTSCFYFDQMNIQQEERNSQIREKLKRNLTIASKFVAENCRITSFAMDPGYSIRADFGEDIDIEFNKQYAKSFDERFEALEEDYAPLRDYDTDEEYFREEEQELKNDGQEGYDLEKYDYTYLFGKSIRLGCNNLLYILLDQIIELFGEDFEESEAELSDHSICYLLLLQVINTFLSQLFANQDVKYFRIMAPITIRSILDEFLHIKDQKLKVVHDDLIVVPRIEIPQPVLDLTSITSFSNADEYLYSIVQKEGEEEVIPISQQNWVEIEKKEELDEFSLIDYEADNLEPEAFPIEDDLLSQMLCTSKRAGVKNSSSHAVMEAFFGVKHYLKQIIEIVMENNPQTTEITKKQIEEALKTVTLPKTLRKTLFSSDELQQNLEDEDQDDTLLQDMSTALLNPIIGKDSKYCKQIQIGQQAVTLFLPLLTLRIGEQFVQYLLSKNSQFSEQEQQDWLNYLLFVNSGIIEEEFNSEIICRQFPLQQMDWMQSMTQILKQEDTKDVFIKTKTKTITAHSFIVAHRSGVLHSLLKYDTSQSVTHQYLLDMSKEDSIFYPYSDATIEEALYYLYTNQIQTNQSNILLELITLSDTMLWNHLSLICQESFLSLFELNDFKEVCQVFYLTLQSNAFLLSNYCEKIIFEQLYLQENREALSQYFSNSVCDYLLAMYESIDKDTVVKKVNYCLTTLKNDNREEDSLVLCLTERIETHWLPILKTFMIRHWDPQFISNQQYTSEMDSFFKECRELVNVCHYEGSDQCLELECLTEEANTVACINRK